MLDGFVSSALKLNSCFNQYLSVTFILSFPQVHRLWDWKNTGIFLVMMTSHNFGMDSILTRIQIHTLVLVTHSILEIEERLKENMAWTQDWNFWLNQWSVEALWQLTTKINSFMRETCAIYLNIIFLAQIDWLPADTDNSSKCAWCLSAKDHLITRTIGGDIMRLTIPSASRLFSLSSFNIWLLCSIIRVRS